MNKTVEKKFTANGIDYEIRSWIKGNNVEGSIFIRAFRVDTGEKANGYEYSVTIQNQVDARVMKSSIDPVKSLIETAENDVINGTWESYQQALKELAANGQ